jgi:hypothetical protein
MFSSNTTQVSGGYEIQRSLRFNSADTAYLNRTPASAGNRTTWTWSGWVKRSTFATSQYFLACWNGGSNDTDFFGLRFVDVSDRLEIRGFNTAALITTQVFRDPSAWYHIVVTVNTTQATADNRIILYVNGSQVTAFDTRNNPAQNATLGFNQAAASAIGAATNATQSLGGYMTEINFIDGQALTPSSFGEINADTGVWGPTRYAGSYGTNGFYLNFSNNSNTTAATLGADYSGNGNNWTPNNFSVSAGSGNDSLVDVPTNWGVDTGVGGTVRGNYATLNPLDNGGLTISNGNLQFDKTASGWISARSTMGLSSGKWYWEITATANSGTFYCMAGIALNSATLSDYFAASATGWAYSAHDGGKYNNASYTAYGSTWTTGDVIGIAFDADAGTLVFYKNNTSQGTAYSGLTSGPYIPAVSLFGTQTAVINFGQRPFAYTAPSGFKALNTQNLPTPTIGATPSTQAGKFFNPVLYTGNSTNRSITGVGFQPDFTWIKRRDPADSHYLFDSVRGATKYLSSDLTAAETTNTFSLTSFDSDGVSLGISSTVNSNTNPFVAWNWKANGAGVTNTAGSITSTVSANTTSGFSVVTYTGNGTVGATRGHGLGVAPSMILVKGRSNVDNWHVYHSALGNTGGLFINSTSGFVASSFFWNDTSPSSTVFTTSSGSSNNSNGVTYVAYCFAEVPGYSRFGSYTGNGSADGPFVFCGFRPAYVMVKRSDNSYDWWIFDDTRSPNNAVNKYLAANSADAENTFDIMDFTANGFKIRNGSQGWNGSGGTIIFMAFAEAPQKFALAR